MEINEKIAELAGIILGDGHLHTKANMITIVGSLEDLEYYQKRVQMLFKIIFNKLATLRKRNDRNAYYLTLSSKKSMLFLTDVVGLKRGSKVNASIPKVIFSKKRLMRAFLRGLFDTDGCLKFSKQTKEIHYYPRVQIALRKSPLASELAKMFKELDFSFGTWEESRFSGIIFYQISGKKNTDRWFSEIQPKNAVHTSKYDFWKEFGYYVPKSSLQWRRKKLSTKIL